MDFPPLMKVIIERVISINITKIISIVFTGAHAIIFSIKILF